MRWLNFKNWSLSLKLSSIMTVLVIITVVVITTVTIRRERTQFRFELEREANLLIETITVSTRNAILVLDADFLEEIVEELRKSGTVDKGYIYDADGRIIADAETDLRFETEVNPFGEKLVKTEDTIFEWKSDRLIAGRSIKIGNQIYGATGVELSTVSLETRLDKLEQEAIQIAIIAVVVIWLITIIISRSITQPLRQLTEATQQIAQGDLNQTIQITSGDEVGTLTNAFNSMIVQLRKTIDDLRQSEQTAQEAVRLKDEFLSVMSHELRTPLNAIMGYQGLLLMVGDLNPENQNKVQRTLANAEQLLGLINDILDISRLESNRMSFYPTDIKLKDFLNRIEAQFEVIRRKKAIELTIDIASTVPPMVKVDEDALTKIITNLVSNAFKFTETGKIELSLGYEAANLLVTVKDTGIGIPAHMQDIIFERFRQVDATTKRKYGGSGLGLSIVQNITKELGGTITVTSQANEGSEFKVSLPVETGQSTSEGADDV